MRTVSVSDARADFAEIVNRVAYGRERVEVHRNGKQLVAIVSMEDLELLRRLEDESDVRDARAALAEVRSRGTVPWDNLKRELREDGGNARVPDRSRPGRRPANPKAAQRRAKPGRRQD